jgi:FKBP-type peptidyl-prolyl cis-trans isomerase SlyD
MQITYGSVVELKYKIYAEDEEETQSEEQYLKIIYGNEPIPRNLEKELFGKEKNTVFNINVPPIESFGEYDVQLVNEIPLSNLKFPEKLQINQFHEEETSTGKLISFKALEIHDDYVLADFNHPLAGKKMIISGKVLDVRKPTMVEYMNQSHLYGIRRGG